MPVLIGSSFARLMACFCTAVASLPSAFLMEKNKICPWPASGFVFSLPQGGSSFMHVKIHGARHSDNINYGACFQYSIS